MANKARVLRQKQLCEFCKKEFLPSKDGRKFCSSYCYNQTRPKKIKNCPTCNKEFDTKNNKNKFCSPQCFSETRKKEYKRVCEFCNKEYISYHKNKGTKFCSNECYFQSKDKSVEKECKNCKEKFIVKYNFRNQKFCSNQCSGEFHKKRTPKRTTFCEFCKNEFIQNANKKYQKKYCSRKCAFKGEKGQDISKICPNCNNEFIVPWNKRNKKFCNKSCANSGEFNVMFGKTGGDSPSFGRKAWNNGLTKETDERLKNLGNKISKTQKEQFKKGKRSNKGKNNPNYGKTRDERTSEQLEKYSKAAVERVKKGIHYGVKGIYYSEKMKKDFLYRSLYELNFMKYFDYCDEIINFYYEPVIIEYDNGEHRYIPDFIVEYKNKTKEMIEVKSKYWLKQDKETIKKEVKTAFLYCKQNNMKFRLWTETKLKQIKEFIE